MYLSYITMTGAYLSLQSYHHHIYFKDTNFRRRNSWFNLPFTQIYRVNEELNVKEESVLWRGNVCNSRRKLLPISTLPPLIMSFIQLPSRLLYFEGCGQEMC